MNQDRHWCRPLRPGFGCQLAQKLTGWKKEVWLGAAILFVRLVSSATGGESVAPTNAPYVMHPQYEVGHWIWAERTSDQQTCRFWKSFVIPKSGRVTQARIRMAVDNSYRLFLDGREIGKGGEWRSLNEYDVAEVLGAGAHTLAVEGFSDYAAAGLVLGLRIQLADGRTLDVPSDATWWIVPNDAKHWETRRTAEPHWPAATVIAPYLSGHWKQASARVIQVPPVRRIVVRFWQTAWFQITLLSVCGVAILVCVYLMSQLASQSKAQQFLHRERARIARDIHDDVGARLTQLVLLGERAQSELPPETRTRAQFDQMCESTRAILGAIDEVLWTVNSRRDTVQDFETYVCNYAESFLQSTTIRCRLDVATEVPEGAFDLAIRRNLFLAIKEALNNAAKHSGATELILRIHPSAQAIVVVVEDNGKGFEPAHADRLRNGLTNMTQRIAEVGGRCRIHSQPGRGCRLEFTTPLVHVQRSGPRWWRWTARERTGTAASVTRTGDPLKS